MLLWWLLPPLFAVMESSCFTGARSDKSMDCSTKERGINSFLWTIRREAPRPPSYLFGTIHVPYDRVWDWIPDNSKDAFSHSDSAIFELDLTRPNTLRALAQCQLLPHGETLAQHIPPELYSRLQRHLDYVRASMRQWMSVEQKRKGLMADYLFSAIAGNWRRKRPVWVMLMVNSLTEVDIKSRGIPVLDLYLAQQAEREGKVTGAVERVEEQCVPLNRLNLSQVLFALDQTLSQHEELRGDNSRPACTSDALIQHYNCGDLNSLMFSRDATQVPALANSSLPPAELLEARLIEQYFQEELIDKRNARMAERVAHLLNAHPQMIFFFAFGAGHFLGVENVIDRLRAAGLVVEHTGPGEDLRLPSGNGTRGSRKAKNFVLNDEFPQPSDVLYGDVDYFFKRKIRHNRRNRKERRRKLRAKKRQERLDSLWENLGPHSFQQENKESQTRKPRKNANFNDLWVRTDPGRVSPDFFLQESDAKDDSMATGDATSDWTESRLRHARQPINDAVACSVSYPHVILFLVCAIWATL